MTKLGRPKLSKADRALVRSVRLTKADDAVYKARGAAAYVRQVLRSPLDPAHVVETRKRTPLR